MFCSRAVARVILRQRDWGASALYMPHPNIVTCRYFDQWSVRAASGLVLAAQEEADCVQGTPLVQRYERASWTGRHLWKRYQSMLSNTTDENFMQTAGADGGPNGGLPCSILRLFLLFSLPWGDGVPKGYL